MTAPSDLPTLYRSKKVYVWVEDEETRTYLNAAWEDPEIGLLVSGGHENIHAVVKSSRRDGFTHVFGFRDRDFGRSNRATWQNKETEVMTSAAFEVENLLLDSEAMAACDVNTSGKTAAQITEELEKLAEVLPWWMSCRRAITEIHDAVAGQFIGHPKRGGVKTQTEAEAAIFASPWWTAVLPAIGTSVDQASVEASLLRHHASYTAMLGSEEWRTHFSGKEVLRDVVTRIWTKRQSARLHIDFIQSIARAQRSSGRVPDEIRELRAALRAHGNLPP